MYDFNNSQYLSFWNLSISAFIIALWHPPIVTKVGGCSTIYFLVVFRGTFCGLNWYFSHFGVNLHDFIETIIKYNNFSNQSIYLFIQKFVQSLKSTQIYECRQIYCFLLLCFIKLQNKWMNDQWAISMYWCCISRSIDQLIISSIFF